MSHSKLLPSARHERRVGAFLVRAAWERRPEGPAYLLPLLCSYISPASVLPSAHTSPLWTSGTRRVFPSSCGRILSLPEFQFQVLSPLALPAGSSEKESVVFEPFPFEIFSSSGTGDRIRGPGQKLLSFWVWLVVRSRDRATPPTM